MKVEQILQTKGAAVHSVRDDASVADAVKVLGEKNIGAVVVKDASGGVAGILSERDIVRRLRAEGAEALNKPVSGCMTAEVITCAPEDTIDDLMVKMTERRIRHVPVMRDGALAGIVSIGDVVKRKIEETEREAAALREYISS
ncbi:CBS domain-containing protein [Amphiplicatus metriothermophilus]|uniref:CBS domain-containing protein n=1 Tax=Amphiplicatus metriothermophilus TaxID=1519374 RepID=A0A239PQ69_9PROT|nr:CBS domain-containing protein [Amphiplicatus metriothermophilus]MBB5518789.1 CBS domain-containing protein [Amphiplicatus metriothermophilus]SNT72056.1 CBS domain-containing protein [Amphiplicatus metriothermophilus]